MAPASPSQPTESSLIEEAEQVTLSSMADVLPSDTRALVLLRDPFRFLDQLGRPALMERFPDRYSDFVEETKRKLGVDLTSPAGFESVGLDPHGPFGVAVVDTEHEVMLLLATVRDAERLRRGDHAWADLDADTVGGAVILDRAGDDGMALLVEEGRAVVLYSQDGDAPRVARQLAKRGRIDRLGVSEAFTEAMQGIEPNRDGLAYANLADDAQSDAFLPDVLGIGTAFEIRGNSLHAQVHVATSEEHPLARVVRAARPSPPAGAPIVRWLDEAPGAVVHLHVDPDVLGQVLVAWVGGFLAFAGSGLDVDLGGEVVPAIDGSIGLAVVSRDAGPAPKDHPEGEPWPKRKRVYTTFVGLRDPRLARAVLERIVGVPLVGGYSLERAGSDYSAADGETLVGIRGQVLVIQNDRRGFAKLDPDSTGSFVWPADGATDPFLLGWDSARLWSATDFDEMDLDWPEPESQFFPGDTAEIRRKVEELTALEKERNEVMKQQFAASRRASTGMLEHMGSTWVALGAAADGLAGNLTYTVPASTFADEVMHMADYWDRVEASSEQYQERLTELGERITTKTEQIDELRQKVQP